MSLFFNTREIAETHLIISGWKETKPGAWISKDRSCAAHILRAPVGRALVQIWEI